MQVSYRSYDKETKIRRSVLFILPFSLYLSSSYFLLSTDSGGVLFTKGSDVDASKGAARLGVYSDSVNPLSKGYGVVGGEEPERAAV